MIVKRKLFSFIDEDGNLGYYLYNEATGEEKLFSVVEEEERLYARGKNRRDLGKGNKKINKKLGRKELIDSGSAGVLDTAKVALDAESHGHILNDAALIEGAKISDARLKKNSDVVLSKYAPKSTRTNSFDELNYNNLKNSDYYNYKLDKLNNIKKEKAEQAAKHLREARLAKAQELRNIKNKKINNAILIGTGAAALTGAGIYALKKHHDKKKNEKKED